MHRHSVEILYYFTRLVVLENNMSPFEMLRSFNLSLLHLPTLDCHIKYES
jgi:hypothetical protein